MLTGRIGRQRSCRVRCCRGSGAFTLVELLVVIGIIALLIAILMPALSRARKQALQVSCGSNERQIIYAALAYANDWEEQLPTRTGVLPDVMQTGGVHGGLSFYARLPVMGWDTVTIWDWATYWYSARGASWLGGLGFVLRDYLKNDFDIYVCPDGWWGSDSILKKWDGAYDVAMGPCDWGAQGGGANYFMWTKCLIDWQTGYLWLPHRTPTPHRFAQGIPVTDTVGAIAKTASEKPSLLLIADYNYYSDRWYVEPGCGERGGHGVAANHNATSYRKLPVYESTCLPRIFPPNIGREENPDEMPLGMNRGRIDARITWVPWQDWSYATWANHDRAQWYSF